jgi:hypothetical protein
MEEDARSSAGSSAMGTPAEKFSAMRRHEPTKRLLVFDETQQPWGSDGSPGTSDDEKENSVAHSTSIFEAGVMQPELHDVAERLWDFALHVDRIEKHKMALQSDGEVVKLHPLGRARGRQV